MATLKDKLVEAANKVWLAFLKYGPVDDGRPEGDAFDEALMELRAAAKRTKLQTTNERKALVAIVNARDQYTEPIHFHVMEAIEAARKVISDSDMIVEE